MSYYFSLSPEELASHRVAFDAVFNIEGSYVYAMAKTVPTPSAADHIGYLIYRALALRSRYRRKEVNIITYKQAYHVADNAFAAWVVAFGLDGVKGEAARMMQRFLAVEDL